jgi:hypothetical protein
MASVNPTEAVKVPHIIYETQDTFQQMIFHLNDNADVVDSDLRYLDSAIGDRNMLTTEALSTVARYGCTTDMLPIHGKTDLVVAINELDSDLHGAGGGNFAQLVHTEAKTVVGAINEIEAVFDANAGQIITDSALDIITNGDWTNTVNGDFILDVTGNITLDADGNKIYFRDGAATRLTHMLGSTNTVRSNGTYVLDATGDIVLDADAGTIVFKDDDVDVFRFLLNSTTIEAVGYLRISGDDGVEIDAEDDIILDAGGNNIKFKHGGQERINWTLGATNTGYVTGAFVIDASTGITLDAGNGYLTLKEDGTTYSRLVDRNGNLRLQSGTTTAIDFTGANALFYGKITLPSSGNGSITNGNISADTVHGAIDELNARIPNVYNRSGTLLNP